MKVTGVLVRFLSLLDVTLILLGVLMVTLMHAQIRTDKGPLDRMAEWAGIEFVCLYAGWGPENGRCYLLGPTREVRQEVRTDTEDDIKKILNDRRGQTKRSNPVVLLLFSDEGWYSAWTPERLEQIEKTWQVKVNPVYNVPLQRKEEP